MKENKYRFWNEKTKEMIYDLSLKTDKGQEIKVCNYPDYISMQYVGIEDKNGVDIYEGDIIQIFDHEYLESVAVEFKDGCFVDSYYGWCLSGWSSIFLEVIGNVYNNPELLENQTK